MTHVATAQVFQYSSEEDYVGRPIGTVICDGTSANNASPFMPGFDQNLYGMSYTYELCGCGQHQ